MLQQKRAHLLRTVAARRRGTRPRPCLRLLLAQKRDDLIVIRHRAQRREQRSGGARGDGQRLVHVLPPCRFAGGCDVVSRRQSGQRRIDDRGSVQTVTVKNLAGSHSPDTHSFASEASPHPGLEGYSLHATESSALGARWARSVMSPMCVRQRSLRPKRSAAAAAALRSSRRTWRMPLKDQARSFDRI